MSTYKMDINIKLRACRICLDSKCGAMVLLDEENGWFKLFQYCFGLTLTSQDEPRVLCKQCADNVESFVKFKEKCEQSDYFWKSVTCNVKCCTENNALDKTIKNEELNDTNENDCDHIDTMEQTNESFELSYFDNDTNFDNDDVLTKIKVENTDELMSFEEKDITIDIGKLDKEECLVGNKVDLRGTFSEKKTEFSKEIIETKEEEEAYTCKMCKKKYRSKTCYFTHIQTCKHKKRNRPALNQNYVYDCGRNYVSENLATDYRGVANRENKLQIKKCIEEKTNEGKNQDSSLFLCGLCELTFTSSDDVNKHLDEHWSNNDLACKLCDFVGVDLAAIFAHRFFHYPLKKRFLCHICKKLNYSLLALHYHYRLVHLKKSGGYCSRCNKEFTKLVSWRKHELTHSCPGYICDICGKRYNYKHMIKEHIIGHLNLTKFICDVCGKIYTRSRYLTLHKKTVHSKIGPFKCTHCNRMFKSMHTLSLHQKMVTREKRIKCEVCFQAFATPTTLKSHMVMHTDERPYCCDICGSRYKAKSQLKVHMRTHTGYLPHKCELCSKPFKTPRQLKVHSSVHTGVRAHSCLHCIRTFHTKKLLLAHCSLRHKNENGEKIECE